MASRGLLSRIAGGGATTDVESIVAHLRVLLNTRRGNSPASPGFGIVDFADLVHGMPAAAQDLARTIRGTISEYEPRLRNVAVRHVPDDGLSLRFEITAQLAAPGGRSLKLATTVRPGGRVDVTG